MYPPPGERSERALLPSAPLAATVRWLATINWTGAAAAAGGVGFAGFWLGSLFEWQAPWPWPVALLLHALVTLLLGVGAARTRVSADGSRTRRTLGWSAVALIVVGQLVLMELTMLGFLLFGVTLATEPRLRRSAGALLATGAVAFLVTVGLFGRFWGDANPTPPVVPSVAFSISLLLIAFGWIVLAVSPRVQRDE